VPKASYGVKLYDLEKAVLSDSEHTTKDDTDNSNDDSISVDSDVSSESNDSDDNSYDSDFLDGEL